MDHSLQLPPTAHAAMPYAADARRVPDTVVPPVRAVQQSATLPPKRPFVAQAVVARLQAAGFSDPPAEILPEDRTLRPYGVPMLPADKTDTPTDPAQELEPADDRVERENPDA
jgi:hypothetical protein